MTSKIPTLTYNDFEPDGIGYRERTAVVRSAAGEWYRATLIHDDDAYAPDGDYGAPLFIHNHDRSDWVAGSLESVTQNYHTGYGDYAMRHDGLDISFSEAWERTAERFADKYDVIRLLDRWLRVFHGGKAQAFAVHPYGDVVNMVSYTTAAMMRDAWGADESRALTEDLSKTASEWVAYFEGEVYGYRIEKHEATPYSVDDPEDLDDFGWEELDSCWGYYGEDYAIQVINETLPHYVRGLGAVSVA